MMAYKTIFTEACVEEIEDICKYISINLGALKYVDKLKREILSRAETLSRFPEIYSRIEKYDRNKREYRRIVIHKYIILYTVDNLVKEVYISRMFYGRKKLFNRSNLN